MTGTLLSQGRPATASSVASPALGRRQRVRRRPPPAGPARRGSIHSGSRSTSAPSVASVRPCVSWEAATARAYIIQTSTDGAGWTTVYSTTTGDGGTDDLTGLTASGRYVRLSARLGYTAGYSLWEFKVYGAGPGSAGPGARRPAGRSPSAGLPSTPAPTVTGTPTPPGVAPSPPGRPAGSTPPARPARADLTDPRKKDIAMQLVSSAENSSLDWRAQYKYIEDIGDGRGYTAGIIGFCSGTGDMLELVEALHRAQAGQRARQVPAGAAQGRRHRLARRASTRTSPATGARRPTTRCSSRRRTTSATGSTSTRRSSQAKKDGLRALGQFAYYDAIVMHGAGSDTASFGGIRRTAMKKAKTPAQGGNEVTYLNAFLDARVRGDEDRRRRTATPAGSTPRSGCSSSRQPRPQHPADLEGLRRPVRDRLTQPAAPLTCSPTVVRGAFASGGPEQAALGQRDGSRAPAGRPACGRRWRRTPGRRPTGGSTRPGR